MDRGHVSIGRFRLDLSQRALSRDGTPVPLGSRALEILCVLAAAKREVVSKDELMNRVWPGAIVEENTIQVHVSALRKALDEASTGQRHVVTIPGHGYRLIGTNSAASAVAPDDTSGPTLPDKPSIAVLPFQSMSADPEQGYFADGVVDEIITALSRFSGLFVIARNSSFTYKGRAIDVKQVGRELGVRYVLEGSVRRDRERVRIIGQLIDAATGVHLWADRFDGELKDIFGVQEQLTASVVGAIAPKLEQAEIERAKRKPTESLDAYDYYLRGRASFHQWTREGNNDALRLFYRAIEIDPDFATAYGMAALCYAQRMMNGWMIDRQQETTETARLAERAVKLGKDDSVALSSAGIARLRVVGDIDAAAAYVDRALTLNPNLAQAWYGASFVRNCNGEPEVALQYLNHAVRLSPIDPLMYNMHTGIGLAHFLAGRYDEAWSWSERALLDNPSFYPALRMAAASHALAGRLEQAKGAMARLRGLDPALRISHVKDILPLRRAEDSSRYAEGLRLAGLPE
jgi:TolB-like protein